MWEVCEFCKLCKQFNRRVCVVMLVVFVMCCSATLLYCRVKCIVVCLMSKFTKLHKRCKRYSCNRRVLCVRVVVHVWFV